VVQGVTEAAVRALLARGSGRNFAATHAGDLDPRLAPRLLPGDPETARLTLQAAIARMARWRVESAGGPVVHATRRTRLFRFVDDIYLLLEPAGAPGRAETRVLARSGSRVGRGDLGQNRRNLAELWRALEAAGARPEHAGARGG
jgi:uncharacterized protein (DUF1499 family)